MNAFTVSINEAVSKIVASDQSLSVEDIALQKDREAKAAKIDAYYAQYDLPLAGHGMQMVLAAEEYNLDWKLLPAIAMRESTGGKHICPKSNNPYGWGSCKIHFESFEEATNTVATNLGGANPRTASYYANKDIKGKLKAYNSVIPAYTTEIFSIMNKIETMDA